MLVDINNFLSSWIILLLVVLTFSCQLIYLRIVSLSLAVTFAGGAYTASIFGNGNLFVSLCFGMLGGIIASIIGAIFDHFAGLRIKALAILASFGFLKSFQAIIEILGKGGVNALPIDFPRLSIKILGEINPSWLPTSIAGLVIFSIIFWLAHSVYGLRLASISVGDDSSLASLFGISSLNTTLITQLIAGCVGGFTGVIMAVDTGLRPDLGFYTCIKAFVVLLATGGNLLLIIPLTAIMILIETLAAFQFGGHGKEMAGFALLATVLIIRGWYPHLVNFVTDLNQKRQSQL